MTHENITKINQNEATIKTQIDMPKRSFVASGNPTPKNKSNQKIELSKAEEIMRLRKTIKEMKGAGYKTGRVQLPPLNDTTNNA